MNVGFIGLGTMGQHMARHLREAGHEVYITDVRKAAGESLVAGGAVWCDTPAEIMSAAACVFTSLPSTAAIEKVALGSDGLITTASAGKVFCDLSTGSPTLIRQIAERFGAVGCAVVDAPVSGGPKGAEAGTLALFIGGPDRAFEQIKPLLECFSREMFYIGDVGTGTVVKLVHNCAGYMLNTALAEVFTLGVRAGVEPVPLWKAIRAGAGGRKRLFDSLSEHFLSRDYDPPAMSLLLGHKDVQLTTELAKELGVPMRLANMTLEEMTEAIGRGWKDRDSRVSMLLQEERAGVHIEVEKETLDAVLAEGE